MEYLICPGEGGVFCSNYDLIGIVQYKGGLQCREHYWRLVY